MSLASLRREAGVVSLLSPPTSNPKVEKNLKLGAYTSVLHLLPADLSGREFCPGRSPGCASTCLHFAGNPTFFPNKMAGRLRKSELFIRNPELFLQILDLELTALERAAERANMFAAVRLNGTSDIPWHRRAPWLFYKHPELVFYDYTKVVPDPKNVPANYHLTFSLSENNQRRAIEARRRGFNVAVVFDKVPSHFTLGNETLEVFDGDESDYRPGDPEDVIIGLKAKGLARKDTTGFVHRVKDLEDAAAFALRAA